MFVVRKPFRNGGQMMLPGSVIEPGSVKWFRTRLKDRVIIEVNAHNFDYWKLYFNNRYGIKITLDTPVVEEQPKEFVAEEQPEATPPKEPVKKVVAAVVKK